MKTVFFQPSGKQIKVAEGTRILEAEQQARIAQDIPCGGHGTCGKCQVLMNGKNVRACQARIEEDCTIVTKAVDTGVEILTEGTGPAWEMDPLVPGEVYAAFDIGTTTVAGYLLDGKTGETLSVQSELNPQYIYGADVISRIQKYQDGETAAMTQVIRDCLGRLIKRGCREIDKKPEAVRVISIVGNPCMQQIFLGMPLDNLSAPPFASGIHSCETVPAKEYLPECPEAKLLIIPDISGYVGADTLGCVLSSGMYREEPITLLIDIGTNGEMVLGNHKRLVSCSTAAGPALEGARISCGMRGTKGAIDHVWWEKEQLQYSTIGEQEAVGICGSGLIDLTAALLQEGIINKRGRLLRNYEEEEGQRIFRITEKVTLTQEDIREVQLAKGAIAAGIVLMAEYAGIRTEQIDRVFLAGAFGSFIRPESACRIGLIPEVLQGKIRSIGNAAGSGSKIAACNREAFRLMEELAQKIEPLELASMEQFQRTFAEQMLLPE